MRQTIIRQRSAAPFPIAETLWVIAGTILLLALGDVVIVSALVLGAAAIAAAWWIRRTAGGRTLGSEVTLASVSHLPTGHREPKKASAHAPWHRHSAA
ncbi:hypothetical protein A5685_14355 [Mycobacterium colombiense]|uniref:Uncharacterized protein n=1 Tax=Mycobacterium colombiense TaxID=339268 RepID=A0A1A2RMC9_9MYCO|nr:hypothetical protein [Mycobacterium colombiense]OBH53131.1 hypothetical protein A5685_14355 [Mycobacterium colombiense]